jgi:nicotinamidase-related amidase
MTKPDYDPDSLPPIGFRSSQQDINLGRSALLIIDMIYGNAARDYGLCAILTQQGVSVEYFIDRVDHLLVPHIQRLRALAARAGSPVIYTAIGSTYDDFSDVHPNLRPVMQQWNQRIGDRTCQVLDPLVPAAGDLVLTKRASSAWNGTDIDIILRARGVDHVIVCGVVTNGCVLTTAIDAWDRGYRVTVPEDACATMRGPRSHDMAVEIMRDYGMDVTTTDALCGTARQENIQVGMETA